MSLFEIKDIDTIFVNLLDINLLRIIFQINKYYYILIKPLLLDFITFHKIRETLKIPIWIEKDVYFIKR